MQHLMIPLYMHAPITVPEGVWTPKIDRATRPFLDLRLSDRRQELFLKSTGRQELFLKSTGRHYHFLQSTCNMGPPPPPQSTPLQIAVQQFTDPAIYMQTTHHCTRAGGGGADQVENPGGEPDPQFAHL